MAGPVITTLLSPNPASGNLTADGTEQTLASSSSASGTFFPRVNLANMVDGDLVVITGYTKANGSDTEAQTWQISFVNKQTDIVPPLPVTITAEDYKITLKETPVSGHHTYYWSVLNLNGT
jgi:hypothetical protein